MPAEACSGTGWVLSSWACTLAIDVLPQTSSGLHKVKLTSVGTRGADGFFLPQYEEQRTEESLYI